MWSQPVDEHGKGRRRMLVIWAALVLAALDYGLLGWFQMRDPHYQKSAAATAAVGHLAQQLWLPVPAVGLAVAWLLYAVMTRGLESADMSARVALQRIQTAMIASLAIFEIVAMVGLFLFFLGAPFETLLRYIGAAVVLMVVIGLRVRADVARVTPLS